MARIVRRRTAEPRRAAGTGPVLPARVRGGSGGPPGPAARQRARGRRRLPQRGAGRRRGPLPRLDLVPPPHRRELTRRDVVGGRGPQRRRCRRRRGLGRGPDRFRGTARAVVGPARRVRGAGARLRRPERPRVQRRALADLDRGVARGRHLRRRDLRRPARTRRLGGPGIRRRALGTGGAAGRVGPRHLGTAPVRRPSGARRSFRRAASSRRPPVRRWWTSARC